MMPPQARHHPDSGAPSTALCPHLTSVGPSGREVEGQWTTLGSLTLSIPQIWEDTLWLFPKDRKLSPPRVPASWAAFPG